VKHEGGNCIAFPSSAAGAATWWSSCGGAATGCVSSPSGSSTGASSGRRPPKADPSHRGAAIDAARRHRLASSPAQLAARMRRV